MSSDKRYAALIDADNISPKYLRYILAELSNDGIVTYKRIYGDWTSPNMNGWKPALLDNSFVPIQQFAYTSSKNSTDSAMIIDAMDILYGGLVDGFCLVSSDSDFTRLSARLREAGKDVIGMGEAKTPAPFRNACSKFRYLEVLEKANQPTAAVEEGDTPKPTVGDQGKLEEIKKAVTAIITDNSDEEGKLSLSHIGNALANRYPDFDVRNFGYSKLSRFILVLGFDQVPGTKGRGIYVRIPNEKKPKKETEKKHAPPKKQTGKKKSTGK